MNNEQTIKWLESEINYCENMLKPDEFKIKMEAEYRLRKELAERKLQELTATNE